MISEPTTLVLGAGASDFLGFPLGNGIIRFIRETLQSQNNQPYKSLIKFGFSKEEIDHFRWLVLASKISTIDTFLKLNPDLWRIGKATIGLALFPHENLETLNKPNRKENWYEYLLNRLLYGVTNQNSFIKNNLSIITYNYDRSLEQYLFIALRAAFNLKSSECRTLMKSIPIIHMHGDLGALPWQLKGGIEYSPQITEKKIASALSNIQLISESTSQALIDMVKKKLLSSRKVFFMGLAYHPDYMDNLEIGKIQQTALRGTLINMLSAEEASVREKYHRMIDFQKLNCYHFLTKNLW